MLHLKKYSRISDGPYFLKGPNELCHDNEIIHEIDQCRSVPSELKKYGVMEFHATDTWPNWPKGCFKSGIMSVMWNNHSSGSANGNARPICKIESK